LPPDRNDVRRFGQGINRQGGPRARYRKDVTVDAREQPLPNPEAVPLLAPRDGVPDVIADGQSLAATVAAYAAGSGPVAVDAERASGYRYSQRAYLVQLRREGAGTALIDPIACSDLSPLSSALSQTEWVLHAAAQDLTCLREVGLNPPRIFDTELGGRLAGYARVGLGPMVEELLGYSLEKGHSADDWSTRPLPEPWLRYAALDVELLVDLREAVHRDLEQQGKLGWAEQEFAAVLAAAPHPPRVEPWRRTSGIHKVRKARNLAVVRALWEHRDMLARRRDMTPGRVLPDTAIVEAAMILPETVHQLRAVPGFSGRTRSADAVGYHAALRAALELPEAQLPSTQPPHDGPPPAKSWERSAPDAAARLAAARPAVAAIADEHLIPVENLLSPDLLRRLCWSPPADLDDEVIAQTLRTGGARAWQVELTSHVIGAALRREAGRPASL
jgi:ribonuclease D